MSIPRLIGQKPPLAPVTVDKIRGLRIRRVKRRCKEWCAWGRALGVRAGGGRTMRTMRSAPGGRDDAEERALPSTSRTAWLSSHPSNLRKCGNRAGSAAEHRTMVNVPCSFLPPGSVTVPGTPNDTCKFSNRIGAACEPDDGRSISLQRTYGQSRVMKHFF